MTETLFPLPEDPPALPVPPLRLRRVKLCGVGPEGARFDPLDLDFTTREGAAARVLLSLTNTGGKSTLITLVCSLIVPAARAQVGGKVLGDYVLTGDTSHIVCEWEDATSGKRTVTGAVMEWKDGRRQPPHSSRSTSNLFRSWYLFTTGPELPALDDLPLFEGGRRQPYRAFCAAVDDLIAQYPGAQGVITDIQQRWTKALEERTSVDPALFGYQMRMNDSEAGAEKLLASFDSPDNVVRFFVAALNDQRELETFTASLEEYAVLAAQRTDLEAIAAFGEEIAPLVELVAARSMDAEAAAGAARRANARGGEHAAALDNRIEQDEASLVVLAKEAEAAGAEANRARQAYGRISDIRQQLLLEEARARVEATGAAVEEASAEADQAERDELAWQAVDAVIDLETERKASEAAERAYEAADKGLDSLRAAVGEAAARTAGRLDALAIEAAQLAVSADAAAQSAKERGQEASDLLGDLAVQLDRIKNELNRIKQSREEADRQTVAAVAAGWLVDGESPAAAVRRWQDTRSEASEAADRADAGAETAARTAEQQSVEIEELDVELLGLRSSAQRSEAKLADFDQDLAGVGDDETVAQLVGGRPEDGAELARAGQMAEESARRADERAAEHAERARAATEELALIDEAGIVPAGQDALAVLKRLTDARIGASTGLSWIERNVADPERRAAYIADRPGLAGGVVVSDPTRFDDGIAVLTAQPVHTTMPIVVQLAPSSVDGTRHEDVVRCHVVVPHRATWDREWAAESRKELERTAESEGTAARDAAEAARRYRVASARCTDFGRRWGQTARGELVHAFDVAAEAAGEVEARRETLAGQRDQQLRKAQAARAESAAQRLAGLKAERHVEQASALAGVVEATEAAAAQLPGLYSRRTRFLADEQNAKKTVATAAGHFTEQTQKASDARSAADAYHRERGQLGVDEGAPDPGENLQVLRNAWQSLRIELASAEQGMVEAETLNRARLRVGQAVERTRRFAAEVLSAARELAATSEASSPASRAGAQNRARTAFDAKRTALASAKVERTQAHKALAEARPAASDHQNFIDLAGTEWFPAEPGDIPGRLERLEVRNAELRRARDEAEAAEKEAQEFVKAVSEDVESLQDIAELWTAARLPTPRVFEGTKTVARDQMRVCLKEKADADHDAQEAAGRLRTAVVATRNSAMNARWSTLEAAAAIRVRSLPETDLVAEAELLAKRIRAMAESAAADLGELDQHRGMLRDSLLSLCRDQRRMLREVSRYSKLPGGLGDLSHQAALKIGFDEAPDEEAAARLANRIDSWSAELGQNPKRAKSSDVRARWLSDAVRDTVHDRVRAGAWSIEILKPSIDGRVRYCPPDRIPIEFSGGQVLTLAVLVYCALSRVRSAHRLGGPRPAGTLLLDNPFGAASAEALIQMQHRLAAHSGVQLVCATGLHDPAVDAAFTGDGSVIVKLRNDGDLRRNLSYLQLRATVVDGVDVAESIIRGRDRGSPRNWVDATRYEVGE
ncbi:hypothetical protein [Amycolatopsis nivea]|uniref:hypothetical protein n=1 Tax=Amycolatopsis nivea TaxID=1644109 RepID=UPI0010702D2D|nr:hypothetical protein [Amycolatopsis nivea]